MDLFYVFEHGDFVLVTTFTILIVMSLLSWYIIFWKLIKLRKEQARVLNFKKEYATQTNIKKINVRSNIVKMLLSKYSFANSILSKYDSSEQKNILSMHLGQTLDNGRAWLNKGLTILATVASSAPFIGLFGTVWGIYGALTEISANGSASIAVVSGPIGEALVATAVGLFAAIPAAIAYNSFVRTNNLLMQDCSHIAEILVSNISQKAN